jgi:hypothetical protein
MIPNLVDDVDRDYESEIIEPVENLAHCLEQPYRISSEVLNSIYPFITQVVCVHEKFSQAKPKNSQKFILLTLEIFELLNRFISMHKNLVQEISCPIECFFMAGINQEHKLLKSCFDLDSQLLIIFEYRVEHVIGVHLK